MLYLINNIFLGAMVIFTTTMSTPPTISQKLVVKGALEVVNDPLSTDGWSSGRITFTGEDGTTSLGGIKSYGSSLSGYRLIVDSARLFRGISFRTNVNQGDQDGGLFYPYLVGFSNTSISLNNYTNIRPNPSITTGDVPGYLLSVQKTLDSASYNSLYTSIADFSMQTFTPNQALCLDVGQSGNFATRIGYKNVDGGTTNSSVYGFLGVKTSTLPNTIENVQVFRDGTVTIPVSLSTPNASITALTSTTLNTTGIVTDTITATNYIGLPPTNVLPITLDPTNSRIGINNTTPTKAVDVVGDVLASGEVAAGSLRSGAFGVGYEPGVKEGWGLYRDSSTLTLYISPLTTAGVPTPSNDVSIEYNTGKVILNSIEATTGLTVGSNLINTDTTNTRVGINKASPAYTLDVGGDVNIPTGSNFMINGVPISSGGSSVITVTSPNVFTATTTPPVKPTNTVADYITVQEIPGSKLCTCTFHIAWTDVTGINAGSGVYFVSLPTGYEFDLTKHPADNVITSTDGSASTGTIIPGSNFAGQMNSGTVTYFIGLGVVYDATRFAVLMYQNGKFWSSVSMGFGAGGGASNPQFSLSGSFQFFKP